MLYAPQAPPSTMGGVTVPQDPMALIDPAESDALEVIRDASDKDNPYLYALRASAYTQVLYAHGLQTFAYSMTQGRMVDLRETDEDRITVIFNIIMPVVEAQKALILAKPPKRTAVPETRDQVDIEAARYASDAMEWGQRFHRLEELAPEAADLFVKMGNFVHFVGWDPSGGRSWQVEDGQFITEGDPVWRIDTMFSWTFHPHAKNYHESPYAHHSACVSRDFLEEHFPDKAHLVQKSDDYTTNEAQVFEQSLKNLSPSHGGILHGGYSDSTNYREAFHELQTLYMRSSPRYPNGRMIIALARGGDPYMLLHDGENPYIDHSTGRRTLPCVVVKNLPVPNRLWGEGPVLHLMPHQRAINRLRAQIYENAEMIANPTGYYWGGSIIPDQWTNGVGGLVEVTEGSPPPGFMQPPEMPSYVIHGEAAALQFADIFSRPVGPLSGEQNANIKSGIHQMIVEETKKQLVAPMVRSWEVGWDRAWKLWIDNWRTFADIPRQIGTMGDDGGWRQGYFSGEMARARFTVQIEAYSAMPTSRTATFAEWIELIKAGAAPIQADPAMARQFWDDIGKGNMARTYRDNTADFDKAQRNIMAVRSGELRGYEYQDNADTHIAVYTNWMKTPEFEQSKLKDEMLMYRMNIMVQSFMDAKAREMAALQMQMMAVGGGQVGAGMNGGGGDQPPSPADRVQGAAMGQRPGNGGGAGNYPRATQSVGKARNPVQDQGGNPGGPQ